MKHIQVKVRFQARRWAGVILAALLLASLAIPMVGAAPARQAADVIRIGYLGLAGSETANGAALAIRQINEFGGVTAPDGAIYQLELVTLTTEPTLDTFGDAVKELTTQDVVALLGPDTNALITPDTIQTLVETRLSVLTAATGDALTDVDAANYIFRIRAPERVFSNAIAMYLVEDLGFESIVVVQTEVEYTEALSNFETSLSSAGTFVSDRVQLPGGEALAEQAPRLLNLSPQAIVMWGAYEDAAVLLQALRDGGWTGVFAYRHADEAARAGMLPDTLADGMLGMNSWSYAETTNASRIFTRDYVVAFGEVPGPEAVAGYDALWFLRAVIRAEGVDPAAIQAGLLGSGPQTLVQGVLHPQDFGNGDLSRNGLVYALGKRGGPSVLARFDDTSRLGVEEVVPTPEVTPLPQVTAGPTATLEGAWVRITANVLNVRTGPGFEYDRVGQVEAGDMFRILGAIADYSWLLIDFQGGVGWVKSEFVEILGDLTTVSIVQPPASPTPGVTATPSLPPNPDLVIDSVVLNPAQPSPGQQFSAAVTIRNAGGGAAGRFAVAATWEPGAVFTSAFVEGLAGGQTTQVQLNVTLNGTGAFQVAVVADLNKEVAELDENNNVYNVTYRVDHAIYKTESGRQLQNPPPINFNLEDPSGNADFKWDGANIDVRPPIGTQIGEVTGTTYENVTYDMLGSIGYNSEGFATDKVKTGAIFAFITSDGRRAVMRIDNLQPGGSIWISYRVYS